jgi:hypothetical protein
MDQKLQATFDRNESLTAKNKDCLAQLDAAQGSISGLTNNLKFAEEKLEKERKSLACLKVKNSELVYKNKQC